METNIGSRIKALRRRRNMTLAAVAEAAGLSPSYLSQVERGRSTPSLSTLSNIATALGVNLRELFEPETQQIHVTQTSYCSHARQASAPVATLHLSHPAGRWKLEVEQITLQPGAPCLEFAPHPGEAFGFVLKGVLQVVMEEEQYDLEAGDSIHFETNRPYRLACAGETPCTALWCSSPPRKDFAAVVAQALEAEQAEVA